MTPAQLDALNAASAHDAAQATGTTIGQVMAETVGGLPSSPGEREAFAERARRILNEVNRGRG